MDLFRWGAQEVSPCLRVSLNLEDTEDPATCRMGEIVVQTKLEKKKKKKNILRLKSPWSVDEDGNVSVVDLVERVVRIYPG